MSAVDELMVVIVSYLVKSMEREKAFVEELRRFVPSAEPAIKPIINKATAVNNVVPPIGETPKNPVEAIKKDEEPNITIDDLRIAMTKKTMQGKREECKTLIEKYGSKNLSGIDPKNYKALLKEVEGL